MTRVTLALLASGAAITLAVVLAITFAKGYQFDPGTQQFKGTGILVATSDPNGAEVRINGILKTATNNSINLPPGDYDVKLELDGYSSWEKKIHVTQEEVFKTNAFLFPKVPDLRPLTLSGAINPTLSPDQTRIAFEVASASADKNGVWFIDMNHSVLPGPINLGTDARQIYQDSPLLSLTTAKFLWSTDSKQLLAYFGPPPLLATPSAELTTPTLSQTPTVAYLLDTDNLNSNLLPLSSSQIAQNLTDWQILADKHNQAQLSKLPVLLSTFLTSSATNIQFSPDESKIMYIATTSASLPTILTSYLPGKDPTPENRNLKPGNLYVYDLKEDKNFEIVNCSPAEAAKAKEGKLKIVNCVWFPSSRHLLTYTDKEISIMEYDGTNRSVVYSGPFVDSMIYSWPNWSKIVIMTSLNASIGENLYTINLR